MNDVENPRKSLKAALRVYYGPSHERMLSGFSVDMSGGGLFLRTDIDFSIDDKVLLSFTLPDVDKTVSCAARVAWINPKDAPLKQDFPPGIGLQFLDLSVEYFNSIQSLLRHDGVEAVDGP
jgi:uncharacterized protein (TIGR02266 family)